MSVSNLSALVGVMTKAADRASKSLLRDFGEVEHLQISRKGPADFVSEADRRAEEILYENLSQSRPGFSFYGEENGERAALVTDGSQRAGRFIVDPLDGTTNFLHGLPHWCISIAAEIDGQLLRASFTTPSRTSYLPPKRARALGWAARNCAPADVTAWPIACLLSASPSKGTEMCVRRYVNQRLLHHKAQASAALVLQLWIWPIQQQVDTMGFGEAGLNAHDVAAGALIASEAGCIVTDYAGSAEFIKNRQIIAGGPMIYEKLRADINQAVQ